MLLVPCDQAGPARRMALAGAAVEIAAAESILLRRGLVAEPYKTGMPGRLMTIARNHRRSPPAATLLAGKRSRFASALAGATYVAASLTTRSGDLRGRPGVGPRPQYVVVPQRERQRDRRAAEASAPR